MYKLLITFALVVGVSYYIIINPTWFDAMYMRFVGKNAGAGMNLNTLTTGRYGIWEVYVEFMSRTDSWVFGNGLRFPMPYGKAAHNIVLQVVYAIGVVGGLIYINCFRTIYRTLPDRNRINGTNSIGVMAMLSMFAIMMFLDLMYLELFYYLISLCFVLMKCTNNVDRILFNNSHNYVKS